MSDRIKGTSDFFFCFDSSLLFGGRIWIAHLESGLGMSFMNLPASVANRIVGEEAVMMSG